MVWSRTDRPAIEHGPAALPGVIVHELPDGWVLISWPYRTGWYAPDAVYETKSVRDVSDEESDRWFVRFGLPGGSSPVRRHHPEGLTTAAVVGSRSPD